MEEGDVRYVSAMGNKERAALGIPPVESKAIKDITALFDSLAMLSVDLMEIKNDLLELKKNQKASAGVVAGMMSILQQLLDRKDETQGDSSCPQTPTKKKTEK